MNKISLTSQGSNVCIKGCDEFEYLGIKINKKTTQNYMKYRINKGR